MPNKKQNNSNTKKPNNQRNTVGRRRRKLRKRGALGPVRGALTTGGATFLRAALDPFSDVQLTGVGVPDEFSGSTLKYEKTMTLVAGCGSGAKIAFTLLPNVAAPIVPTAGYWSFTTLDTSTPRLVNIANESFDDIFALEGNAMFLAIPWSDWFSVSGVAASSLSTWSSAYSIRSQRVISLGCEIRYLGSDLTNQGAIYAARLPGVPEPARFQNTKGVTPDVGLALANYWQNCDVSAICGRNNSATLSNNPGYVVQTLKSSEGSGGMIVLRNDNGSWDMVPYNFSTYLCDDAVKSNSVAGGTGLAIYGKHALDVTPAALPMPAWQSLDPVGVSIEGLLFDEANSTSGAVEIRLKMYVEATIDVASQMQCFTTKSPSHDEVALNTVATVSKGLPVMVPVTMNSFGGWWKRIMGVISSLGRIVGGVGLPMVSPIASGVGGIADILGSFASL